MSALLRRLVVPTNKLTYSRLLVAHYSAKTGSKEFIEAVVKDKPVVVFMKGTPAIPRCGFSNAVVQILHAHGVQHYDAHNVLADEDMRQGVKDYTEWPTIPQVFFGGEFIGGCDILFEMHKSGELVKELKKVGIESMLVHNDTEEGDTKES
ncbi:glutaredoxin-related protein 5, mitochondrial-like [Mizuhopecten yessoensis]|uniref:Glutaredoxin-related protein 5, mitochondrial n=1 Tax=Mizuhopecten yessoensis TaxID=6573 RepID=A0A210PQ44_MIZYE|nr:glutaredoxin-related protein 5, mitochondrial-like [Mizuhopecten yessoensis]OWF38603.1 Glutaredoxin-related protein 5, mitochondrial [Mizuhopecten yessoensis]